MSVTVDTVYVYNVKTRTMPTKDIGYTKDKWVGDNNCGLEKSRSEYFKEDLKL